MRRAHVSLAFSPAQRAALTSRRVPSHPRVCSGHSPIRLGWLRAPLAPPPRVALTSALVSTRTLSLPPVHVSRTLLVTQTVQGTLQGRI